MFTDNEVRERNYHGYNPQFVERARQKRIEAENQRLLEDEARQRREREVRRRRLIAMSRRYESERKARVLEPETPNNRRSMRAIVEATAEAYRVRYDDIMGRCRTKIVIPARDAAIRAIADERPDQTASQIARFMDRDHTTILHSLKKTKQPGQAR